jgi:hypothetical protein
MNCISFKTVFSVLFVMSFLWLPVQAKDITIAVPRFTVWTVETTGRVTETVIKNYSALGGMEYRQLDIKNGRSRLKEIDCPVLTDVFIRHLVNSGRFTVVDRAKTDKILGEIKLGEEGFTDPSAMVKKGKMLGAQYLVVGTVVQADMGYELKDVPYTEQHVLYEKGVIRVEMRVLETETGRIISAQLGEGLTAKRKPFDSKAYGTKLEQYDPFFDQPFVQDMYDALAVDLTSKTVNAFYPFKVVAVSGNSITANRGRNFGIAIGDIYNITRKGEQVKDPDTGKILGNRETIVTTAKVEGIQEEMCTLTVADVNVTVKNGDVLKPAVDPKTKFRDTPY